MCCQTMCSVWLTDAEQAAPDKVSCHSVNWSRPVTHVV